MKILNLSKDLRDGSACILSLFLYIVSGAVVIAYLMALWILTGWIVDSGIQIRGSRLIFTNVNLNIKNILTPINVIYRPKVFKL